MMITCAKCGRKHPMTDADIAYFYPRFFCLSCGQKLPFEVPEAKLQELRRSNDPSRRLPAEELASLPPSTELRRVAQGAVDLESNG
ncbi:MAG TPA: hypothetical protein VKW04_23450 [Planctomycetota bacterium]|nr:hypothetical protein [Planctomycetota bacterium]